jgi:hypothetical protein
MTVSVHDNGAIQLRGSCKIEDAETLLQMLLANVNVTVDWRSCDYAHTAVIQVLLALQPTMIGPPASEFLSAYLGEILPGLKVEPGA